MKKVDFKTSGYFSGNIIFLGLAFFVVALPALFVKIGFGLILLLLSILILTTHYRLTIDFDNKVFRDYLWIMSFKNRGEQKFERIEYVFLKENRVSTTMQLRVSSSTIHKQVYDGYLKFSEEEKIHLLTKDSKKDLVAKLRDISTMLNVEIIDYTEGEPKEI